VDEQLKRRLVGATVLVALAIIFLPMLLEHEPADLKPLPMPSIPKEPPRHFPGEPPRPAPAATRPAPKTPSTTQVTKPSPSGQQGVKPVSKADRTKPKPAHEKTKSTAKPKSATPPTPSAWVVQVASLSSRDNAMKLVKRLRKAGLDTMDPRPVTVKGKRFYRVLVGPEVSKKNAERHQSLISQIAGTKGRVVRYP
jgi:DedD protein